MRLRRPRFVEAVWASLSAVAAICIACDTFPCGLSNLSSRTNPWISVSGTDGPFCGIRADGEISCWGAATVEGILDPPTGPFRSVSAGFLAVCGVRPSGQADCWGDPEVGDPDPDIAFSSVGVGFDFACGVRSEDGRVTCWGDAPEEGPPDVPFLELYSYASFVCGVTIGHEILCWGTPQDNPFLLAFSGHYSRIRMSEDAWCAIRTDQTLQCVGDQWGQDHPPAGQYVDVGCGWVHCCALGVDGRLSCWGVEDPQDQWDSIEWGSQPRELLNVPGGRFSALAVNSGANCGIDVDGNMKCWDDYSRRHHTCPP